LGSANGDSQTIGLGEVLRIAKRHAWIVMVSTAVCVAAVAWVVSREVPKYEARGLVRLADTREVVTGGIEAPDREPHRFLNPALTQIELLQSRALIGSVVDSIGFRLRPDYQGFDASLVSDISVDIAAASDSLQLTFSDAGVTVRGASGEARAEYGQPVELGGVSFTVTGRPEVDATIWVVEPRAKSVDRIVETLRVRLPDRTNVAVIKFTDENPVFARDVVNRLATEFQLYDAHVSQQQSRRRREFLQTQLQKTDSMLRVKQYLLSRERGTVGVYSSEEELEARRRNRMELELRRAELEADRRVGRSLLARLDTAGPEARSSTLRGLISSPIIAANPVIGALHVQLMRYEVAYDSLTTGAWRRSDSNPDVQRQAQLIAATEEQLIATIRNYVASLDPRIEALDELRTVTAGEMTLIQDVETLEGLANQLRGELQRAQMAEAVEIGEVEIVDYAGLPYEPIGQMEFVKLFLGLLLGLGIGGGIGFLREQGDQAIRRREQLERALSVPSLAIIPRVSTANGGAGRFEAISRLIPRWRSGNGHAEGEADSEADGEAGDGETRPEAVGGRLGRDIRNLVSISARPSVGAEAYRLLRTHLLFHGPLDRPLKTIVVTSPSPGDGKTLTAANLAGTYARAGARVLLVDGDLFKGRINEVFDVPRGPGVTDLLRGEGRIKKAVVETYVPGLSLLPAGTKSANPGRFVSPGAVRRLFDEVSSDYDLVIIDTPPVLAVADTTIVAALADGVVLVVRAGKTPLEAAQHALRQLERAGAQVVGSVLNDPTGHVDTYRRYRYEYAVESA
jgi:succinoglycan biosynthesis transport protein ExoP